MSNRKEIEKRIIENYQNDEQTMILIFSQWCVNNDLDPVKLYHEAYPEQMEDKERNALLEKTIPKAESDEIADDILFQVLDVFGNHDLAFVVQNEIEKRIL